MDLYDFNILQTETLYPLNNNFPFLPPLLPVIALILSVSTDMSTLDTSYTWNTFVFLVTGLFH